MNDNLEIYNLLEKEFLTDIEKIQLSKMISENPEVSEIVDFYNRLKNAVKKSAHIDVEILSEYILFQNSNEASAIFLKKLQPKIEDHLRVCGICMENYKSLNSEFLEITKFVDTKIVDKKAEETKVKIYPINVFNNFRYTKYITAIAAILLIYVGSLFYSNFTTPNYQNKVMEYQSELNFNSRGRTTEEFLLGISELENGNFENAIEALNLDLSKNQNSQTIFYTHFILGQIYLQNSQNKFIGINFGFDKNYLSQSISEFNKSIETNNDERFANIISDSHYFIAQSYLLLNETKTAKVYLQKVIDSKGKYYSEALELNNEIEGK
ncbi:MAG: hypothetical protein IPM32_13980 [Ignavibacteriae bacterium]|nr:hypothetical protein [Ignavibacteriota bacterium]